MSRDRQSSQAEGYCRAFVIFPYTEKIGKFRDLETGNSGKKTEEKKSTTQMIAVNSNTLGRLWKRRKTGQQRQHMRLRYHAEAKCEPFYCYTNRTHKKRSTFGLCTGKLLEKGFLTKVGQVVLQQFLPN